MMLPMPRFNWLVSHLCEEFKIPDKKKKKPMSLAKGSMMKIGGR